jgi:hydrogenase maturation protein HypF
MKEKQLVRIHITGVVQGVGFRPFVYGVAKRLALTGWVRNTSAGVDIEAEGPENALANFLEAFKDETPPLARIDSLEVERDYPRGYRTFEIADSQALSDAFQPISPDVSVCTDCLHELFDPNDRRFRYPFINCTNCGPRFTIIKDIPYDRPNTTMDKFEMCPACATEYHDPLNRRFHAQPVACGDCGPQIWFEAEGRRIGEREEALQQARALLVDGGILAVKGLGGFHLACDATNPEAVAELRRRKLRVEKPFGLMMPDLEAVEAYCFLDAAERKLIESAERPIVILNERPNSGIAAGVAPGQKTLGVMLPYTPLHYLLIEPGGGFPDALVMTSGNLGEEPIITHNDDARQQLARLADAFLLHDREIHVRCDDSVMRIFSDGIYPVRRSRGYAPNPVRLQWKMPPLLAAGAELKNAFCITNGHYAFLSHHIGDLENYETLLAFENGVSHFERLFRVHPKALAYDLHPDYMATRYIFERAERDDLPKVGVQHHHAHIAACMAENNLPPQKVVIGVAFDGTGYGEDGAIWGGEFMTADYASYQRLFHLKYVRLAGGDVAVRQPWRLALAWLAQADLEWSQDLIPVQHASMRERQVLKQQLSLGLNAPPTSSMGRLFDAVSALAGVRQEINYEAQAAIELEALVDSQEDKAYPFAISDCLINPIPMFQSLVADIRDGVSVNRIAARFHNGIAQMVLQVCRRIRSATGLKEVVLSGGVWQNMTLLSMVVPLLKSDGFRIYFHRQVPANDGGVALGQAVVATARLAGLSEDK